MEGFFSSYFLFFFFVIIIIIILLGLQSWKGPRGSSSPVPLKEARGGIEPPTFSSTARCLNP